MTFDELRAAYPLLGFALYAYEPGDVVLEIVAPDGEMWTLRGPTAAGVIAAAGASPVRAAPQTVQEIDIFD